MLHESDANERRIRACYRLRLGMDDMRLTTTIHPHHLPERRELFKRASPVFIDANIPEKTLQTAFR